MTGQPLLYLPNGTQPSGDWAPQKPAQELPKIATRQTKKGNTLLEFFGRKKGEVAGSYMDGLSSRKKTIWLCGGCRFKFDHKRAHYFYEKNLRVQGRCDGCREHRADSHLFIHESMICDHGGKIRHEHIWTPR